MATRRRSPRWRMLRIRRRPHVEKIARKTPRVAALHPKNPHRGEPANQSASKGRTHCCYFTRKGFCAGRGCDPIVIEAFDAPPPSLLLPGTGKA